MSADKYSSIFSRQMATIVYIFSLDIRIFFSGQNKKNDARLARDSGLRLACFSRYRAPIHWLAHGHMKSNNETLCRQMPLAGNIAKAMTSNGKQFTVTREMLNAVSRDQRLPDVVCICFVLLDKKTPRILA